MCWYVRTEGQHGGGMHKVLRSVYSKQKNIIYKIVD